MDPSPEVLGGLLLAGSLGLLCLTRPKDKDETPFGRMLHDLEEGICPHCESVHSEAAQHTGDNGFWTTFTCPECGYSMSAHVHHKVD